MATNNTVNAASPIPAFFVYRDTTLNNATGKKAHVSAVCNHTLYDTTSSYNTGTYTYTIPTTGKYVFSYAVTFTNLTVANDAYILNLNVTGAGTSFFYGEQEIGGICNAAGLASFSNFAQGIYTAGDTIVFDIQVQHGAADTVGIYGDSIADPKTWFSGYMIYGL